MPLAGAPDPGDTGVVRRWIGWASLVVVGAVMAACGLNPQPDLPATAGGGGLAGSGGLGGTAGTDGDSGGGGTFHGTSEAGIDGEANPDVDGGVGPDADAGDAGLGADVGSDGDAAQATD